LVSVLQISSIGIGIGPSGIGIGIGPPGIGIGLLDFGWYRYRSFWLGIGIGITHP